MKKRKCVLRVGPGPRPLAIEYVCNVCQPAKRKDSEREPYDDPQGQAGAIRMRAVTIIDSDGEESQGFVRVIDGKVSCLATVETDRDLNGRTDGTSLKHCRRVGLILGRVAVHSSIQVEAAGALYGRR